jgi:septal ring factor EnvC (AmiA/AmiB activator)
MALYHDARTDRRAPRAGAIIAAVFAAAIPLGLGTVAFAQQAETPTAAAPAAVPKAEPRKELESVYIEHQRSIDAEAKLRAELDAIGEDRRKLNQTLIDTATRLRGVEGRIAAAEARLAALENNAKAVRASLARRQAAIVEVLAALQRMGRRPPPAVMVSPEDALQSVRTAILLGAVLPEMRSEAEALAADLTELVKVRDEIAAERDGLGRDLAALSDEKDRMTLLVQERQKRQAEAEKALAAERGRAAGLARQANDLKDLIARMESQVAPATRAAAAARTEIPRSPGAEKPGANGTRLAALHDPGRLSPAIAFASAKGALPLPVNGIRVRQFGDSDGLGGNEKGLSIASRPGAQVTAPCDGWVVYAGPFRSYGQLLILNAGGGYHVLLAGMERISVDLGQFVLTGEPVAVMGGGPQTAAAVATGSSQPILYVEFRKDGSPVDPSPWWAATDSEKVRG